MFSLSVKNNKGDILKLTDNKNYIVYKIEGLTPPQATINTSVNTTTDGSTINSTRLENRNIVIYMTIEGNIEANRINLYKYFPTKKTITLYFNNGTRKVYINGTVELIECDLFANKQVAQISIICPNPYFKDIEELTTCFSDVSPLFEFPFSIPSAGVEISTVTPNIRKSIINAGDAESGVIIKLFATGTVVNPTIYDVLKQASIGLNITMQQSDTIIINTNIGEKGIYLIRSGQTTNILGLMKRNSQWFTLDSGDNVFTYDCESGASNLQITFTTSILYGGV